MISLEDNSAMYVVGMLSECNQAGYKIPLGYFPVPMDIGNIQRNGSSMTRGQKQ